MSGWTVKLVSGISLQAALTICFLFSVLDSLCYDCCITCLFVDSNLVKCYICTQKDEEVEFWRQKFAGSQADRKEREEAEAVKVAAQLKKTKVSG